MSCNCFGTLQEAQLVRDCYPPSKAILTAGPDFKPLSSDLSKLTYRCTNQSSRLAKVGDELEKRVVKEAGKSTAGYAKSRASLLISLAILRTLITECHRDLHLFSRSIIRIIDISLDVRVYQKGGPDLEVIGRAASCFTAYTTFTDGGRGMEDSTLKMYLSVLQKFAAFATARIGSGSTSAAAPPTQTSNGEAEESDSEQENRTRLIGLAALHGAASSHALFSTPMSEFPPQVGIIVPALCTNLFQGSLSSLQVESARIEVDSSPSPFFSEFSARRPVQNRRAPSLSAHIPGQKGPSQTDVLSAALRSLAALIRNCQVPQATYVLDAIANYLDLAQWQDVERSCWLAERLAALMSLQYRFVVPTRLVEILAKVPDAPLTTKHTTLVAMITSILSSSTSLVGLGVVEMTNSFISLISRRVRIDPQDALLPALVQCSASLGTHIYYADQINDVVEEIAVRMTELDVNDKARPEILRVLIHCIMGLLSTAIRADELEAKATAHPPETPSVDTHASPEKDKGKAPASTMEHSLPTRTGRRNLISPQVWQETVPLLCEATYPVRSAYARALLLFIKNELPREPKLSSKGVDGDVPPSNPSRPGRPEQIYVKRFCNALNAAIYTLAMSSCLGPGTTPATPGAESPEIPSPLVGSDTANGEVLAPTPIAKVNASPLVPAKDVVLAPPVSTTPVPIERGKSLEKGVSFNLQEPTPVPTPRQSTGPGQATPRKSSLVEGRSTPPRKSNGGMTPPCKRLHRRVSLPLTRLNSTLVVGSFDNVATPYDFTAIIQILEALIDAVPSAVLLTSVPMLLALDRDASVELVRRSGDGRQGAWVFERKRSIKEVIGAVWRLIGQKWGIGQVIENSDKAINTLAEPFEVPSAVAPPPGILPPPDQPVQFVPNMKEGESSASSLPFMDPEMLVSALTSSPLVLQTTQKDASSLTKNFTVRWSVESALKDSVERFSSIGRYTADDTHHFDVASVIMSLNNNSYHSVGQRTASRTIDVSDLREALGDGGGGAAAAASRIRNDSINGSAPPSIVSTAGNRSVDETTPKKKPIGQNTDVQEVLKDIFKGTKRRGGNTKRGIQAKVENVNGTIGRQSNGDALEMKQLGGVVNTNGDVVRNGGVVEAPVGPRHPEGPASLLTPKEMSA